MYVRVFLEIHPDAHHLLMHDLIEGVKDLRPVQGDDGHPVCLFDPQMFIGCVIGHIHPQFCRIAAGDTARRRPGWGCITTAPGYMSNELIIGRWAAQENAPPAPNGFTWFLLWAGEIVDGLDPLSSEAGLGPVGGGPAVIAAGQDNIELIATVGAVVRSVQPAGAGVKGEVETVAQPVGEDARVSADGIQQRVAWSRGSAERRGSTSASSARYV